MILFNSNFFKFGIPILIVGLLLFIVSFGSDNPKPIESNTLTEKSTYIAPRKISNEYENFGNIFNIEFLKSKCPGAAIVIIKDSSIVYMDGLGVLSSSSADSVDLSTVFRLGSVSKGFTGVLTGKLIEKGYFNWDTKIQKHLPSFVLSDSAQASRIEVKHLLSHTSGLPRHSYTNLIEDGMKMSNIKPMLKNVALISKEGQMMSYQNAAFSIIEEFIEASTSKDFNQLLREEIFIPASMNSATSTLLEANAMGNRAQPQRWNSKIQQYYDLKHNNKYYNAVSAGGINASILDMANWLQVVMGNKPTVIGDSTLEEVFSSEVKTTRNRKYFNKWQGVTNSYYAKGWRKIELNQRDIMYHGGYVNQFRSEIAIDRKNKIGICVLFNAPVNYSSAVVPSFFAYCDSIQNTFSVEQSVRAMDSVP